MALTGQNTNPATLNANVANMAVQMRNLMQTMRNFAEWFNNLSLAEVQTLFGLAQADASTMQTMIAYMENVYGVYYGTVYQGGNGTAQSLPILFDFDSALSVLWGGQ